MNFAQFIDQAWNDHVNDAAAVASQIPHAFELIHKKEDIPQLAHLLVHVFGEHLGRWDEGVSLLNQLKTHPHEDNQAIERSIATLEVASGKSFQSTEFSPSDQIRIYAVAAAALSGQANTLRAKELLQTALDSVSPALPKTDPAFRALAITGNNLACALEEKISRSVAETELMIFAAQVGRKYWEIAATWLEVKRAEYRLAYSYLRAGDLMRAYQHAQICVEMAELNTASDIDMFFGYEVLALVEKARGNETGFLMAATRVRGLFEKLSDEDKKWCEKSLQGISI